MRKDIDDEIYAIILSVIGYLIELFSILIYNEIIVINKWDLNKYTVKGLADREKKEHDVIEEIEEIELNQLVTYDVDDDYYIDDKDNDNDNTKNNIEMKTI